MKITAVTNVFLAVALEEPEREQIVDLTSGHELVAPEILAYEVGNALSALYKRDILSAEEVLAAWNSVRSIPVDQRQIEVESALTLAVRFGIYAYDAYFLECALRLGTPLLTLDKGMKHIGKQLHLKLLEVGT